MKEATKKSQDIEAEAGSQRFSQKEQEKIPFEKTGGR